MLSAMLSAIGLLSFPCGTLISACLLHLFFSHKGEMVFSDRYDEIIQGTPHIKYKPLIIVWIFLFILIGVILAAIIATEVAVR
jgi:hypothetical protein